MSRASSVWPWALTAAGVAAVVCLVGWPRPTAYALAVTTGASVLLAGLLWIGAPRAMAERRSEEGPGSGPDRPDRSSGLVNGRMPEGSPEKSADNPEPAPADPDDLRTRLADALTARLSAVAPTYPGSIGVYGAPTPLDLADVVLAIVRPELDRLADQSGTCDASEVIDIGFFGRPHAFGPCILRHGHSGPVHKAANGAQWWPTNQPDVALTPPADQPDGSTT